MLGRVNTITVRRRAAGLFAAVALGLAALAGCSSEGVDTSCSLDSCTLTFDRGVSASANILGVEVKLVDATDDQVTLDVAATVPTDSRHAGAVT